MARRHSAGVPASDADARLARARRELDQQERRTFPGIYLQHARPDESDVWARRLKRETGDDVVLKALANYGLAVLHPRVDVNDEGANMTFAQVQTLVWERITRWHRLARRGQTPAEREKGARLFARLGKALAGERRGRRRVASPVEIHLRFKRNERRLVKARELLDTVPDGVSRSTWFDQVAEACRIPPPVLAGSGGLSRAGQRTSLRDAAIEWTAKEYGLSDGRVANIISKPRRRSRKT